MDNKIYFSIPDFWEKFEFNIAFLKLYFEQRDKFYDDIVIDTIYGNFPCIWNGGRIISGSTNGQNILKTVQPFNEMGIGVRLTCTNSLITESHLTDTLGNQILTLCENELNSVNVASPIMKEYVEIHYPKYSILWSTTLWEKNVKRINKLSETNTLVLDYGLNNKFDILKKLQHPEHIEILCSELCRDNCPYRKKHYEEISKYNMGQAVDIFDCPTPRSGDPYYATVYNNKSFVDLDNIRHNYLPLGIDKFKINGRGERIVNVLERYINYFVKPEFKDDIRNRILLQLYI